MFKVCCTYESLLQMPYTVRVAVPDGTGKAFLGRYVFDTRSEMWDMAERYYLAFETNAPTILDFHRRTEKDYAQNNPRGMKVIHNIPL